MKNKVVILLLFIMSAISAQSNVGIADSISKKIERAWSAKDYDTAFWLSLAYINLEEDITDLPDYENTIRWVLISFSSGQGVWYSRIGNSLYHNYEVNTLNFLFEEGQRIAEEIYPSANPKNRATLIYFMDRFATSFTYAGDYAMGLEIIDNAIKVWPDQNVLHGTRSRIIQYQNAHPNPELIKCLPHMHLPGTPIGIGERGYIGPPGSRVLLPWELYQ